MLLDFPSPFDIIRIKFAVTSQQRYDKEGSMPVKTPGKKTVSKSKKAVSKSPARKKRTARKKVSAQTALMEKLADSAQSIMKKAGSSARLDKDVMAQMTGSTREQLRKLGDKLGESTDKGVHVAKDLAEKIRNFAVDATELIKLKIELNKLKSRHDKLVYSMGKKIFSLYKLKKLTNLKKVFKADVEKLLELRTGMAKVERQIRKISLSG